MGENTPGAVYFRASENMACKRRECVQEDQTEGRDQEMRDKMVTMSRMIIKYVLWVGWTRTSDGRRTSGGLDLSCALEAHRKTRVTYA